MKTPVIHRFRVPRVPLSTLALGSSLLLALAAAVLFLLRPLAARNALDSFCDQPNFSFGDVSPRAAGNLEHSFRLKNTGSMPLRILQHEPSCGCTTILLTKSEIQPGQSCDLFTKVNWTGRVGPQIAHVRVVTDSHASAEIMLTLRATIAVPITISPARINFGDLNINETAERTVEIAAGRSTKPFKILGVKCSDPRISVIRTNAKRVEPIAGGPGKFNVKFSSSRSGREEIRVIFSTDLEEFPELTMNVAANVQSSIRADPPALFLSIADTSDTLVHLRSPQMISTDSVATVVQTSIGDRSPIEASIEKRARNPTNETQSLIVRVVRIPAAHAFAFKPVTIRVTVAEEVIDIPVYFK